MYFGNRVLKNYAHLYSQIRQSVTTISAKHQVFDRKIKKLQKERAIIHPESKLCDYLKEEVGHRLYDNLIDIKKRFDNIVDLSCGRGYISKLINSDITDEIIVCDVSSSILDQCEVPQDIKHIKLVIDEEHLPFEENSVGAFVSCLSLHWVNNLPGTFTQILKCLKKDGVFLAAIFGGDTLYELRSSLQLAELEREGGVSVHVSPFTEVRDVGSLLTSAGYTLLTIDTDEIIVGYPSMFELMWDLQAMGENNAVIHRCSHLNRDTMLAAAAIYENMYGEPGKIRATFQIINVIAWKPDASQQSPLPRGSGEISFKDLHQLNSILKQKGYVNLNEKENKK